MVVAPAWLTTWNGRRVPDRFAGQTWTRLLPDASIYDKYAGPDAVAGERDGKDTTFPHAFTTRPPRPQYYGELRSMPFADELTLEFAIEAMKQHELGDDAATDILAIGFSGTDGVGHAYGPARGIYARRVPPDVLEKAVAEAFAKKYPGAKGLISYFATDFYFDEEVIRQHDLSRKDVEATAIAALLSTGVVDRVYTHDDLRTARPSSDPFLRFFQNAFYEPRSPHLTLLPKRDVNLTANVGGTGHGSVYEYDRHVPVVFMGPSIAPGRYSEPSGPEDIAPTLGRLLGIDFPREYDARLLSEIFSSAAAADARK
jgi:hypothetical protein